MFSINVMTNKQQNTKFKQYYNNNGVTLPMSFFIVKMINKFMKTQLLIY